MPVKSSTPVLIGTLPLGGDYPVRIQSMTNTDTLDTRASVAQCIRIIEAGADLVRLTAQGEKEARNLALIKRELRKAGYETPLVADIHFNPAAAEIAAGIVEKVRINPGNYADKRASFIKVNLSDKEYREELERIHERLQPLLRICRENNTAIRVGVNHGSLSDRIMTRYGNTPLGMTISAMEFINIMRAENFHNLVLSMKSSDTSVMIEATRMLMRHMTEAGFYYPLHLGVTEAGEGDDGRIRSAAGIGTLLSEGIGDTIRVSLSEDPEIEIPVAKALVSYCPRELATAKPEQVYFKTPALKPSAVEGIRGPLVIANMSHYVTLNPEAYLDAGFTVESDTGSFIKGDGAADIIIASYLPEIVPKQAMVAIPFKIWLSNDKRDNIIPLFSPETWYETSNRSDKLNLILTGSHFSEKMLKYPDPGSSILIFTYNADKERFAPEKLFKVLERENRELNVILNPVFNIDLKEELNIKVAATLGSYINDNRIAGISVTNRGGIPYRDVNRLCFSILQATSARITRTMYLSCPTCGRTRFNLQDAVRKVKERTGHLKGLKIAVMGCIVNGPGEMAGADWGYVGAARGKVHIYKGTEAVLKNIPEESAVDELLRLIDEDQAKR